MDALANNSGFHQIPGLSDFLRDYPQMAIRPMPEIYLRLVGRFDFIANHEKVGEIQDSYALRIDVPRAFPKDLPTVTETEWKIPRNGEYHVNADGTLCLGSPIALLLSLSKKPSLIGFADNCLVPYLYAVSCKLRNKGIFPFGELAHGQAGLYADYENIFRLKHREQVLRAVELLTMRERLANKMPCPCGCGKRLGICRFNNRLRSFRALANREWFKSHLLQLRIKIA